MIRTFFFSQCTTGDCEAAFKKRSQLALHRSKQHGEETKELLKYVTAAAFRQRETVFHTEGRKGGYPPSSMPPKGLD